MSSTVKTGIVCLFLTQWQSCIYECKPDFYLTDAFSSFQLEAQKVASASEVEALRKRNQSLVQRNKGLCVASARHDDQQADALLERRDWAYERMRLEGQARGGLESPWAA